MVIFFPALKLKSVLSNRLNRKYTSSPELTEEIVFMYGLLVPWFEIPTLFTIRDLFPSENMAILAFFRSVVGYSWSIAPSLWLQKHLLYRKGTSLGGFWVLSGYFINGKRLDLFSLSLLANLKWFGQNEGILFLLVASLSKLIEEILYCFILSHRLAQKLKVQWSLLRKIIFLGGMSDCLQVVWGKLIAPGLTMIGSSNLPMVELLKLNIANTCMFIDGWLAAHLG